MTLPDFQFQTSKLLKAASPYEPEDSPKNYPRDSLNELVERSIDSNSLNAIDISHAQSQDLMETPEKVDFEITSRGLLTQ